MYKQPILQFFLFLLCTSVHAQSEIRSKHFNLTDGIAISGYDPVAYFISGKAIEGKAEYRAVNGGITYHFFSASTRDLFLKNPEKYEPQYGGWCAYAMGSSGEKVEVDPETFKIVNGKLYLFYNAYFNNTLTKWNKNETELKTKADQNWTKIFH
jgi:YHS domain-containing protein